MNGMKAAANIKTAANDAIVSIVNDGRVPAIAAAVMAAMLPLQAYAGALDGVVNGVGGLAIAVVAIIGIVIVAKGIADHITSGNTSIGKIITEVFVVLLVIGIIFVFMNYQSLENTFGTVATKGTELTGEVATEALG